MSLLRLDCSAIQWSDCLHTAVMRTKILYLCKSTEVTAEDLSTWMSLDHDLSFFLSLGGEVEPAFHRFTSAKETNLFKILCIYI